MTFRNLPFSAIGKLDASHDVGAFDCGKEPLDRFLKRYALSIQNEHHANTYVVCGTERRVIGYYSIGVGAVGYAGAPGTDLCGDPIRVVFLVRLAIDRSEQGKGLGKALLKDAMLRLIEPPRDIEYTRELILSTPRQVIIVSKSEV